MAGSALSSPPLSSPSPSPEPTMAAKPASKTLANAPDGQPAKSADNDSELSELTEDEQDRRSHAKKKKAAAQHSSTSHAKLAGKVRVPARDDDEEEKEYETEEEQDARRATGRGEGGERAREEDEEGDDDADDSAKSSGKETDRAKDLAQGRRVRPRPQRPRSKKRNSIVPAPMWGWVNKHEEEEDAEEGEQPEEEEEEGELGEDDNEREEPEPEDDTAPPPPRMPPPPATNADDFLRQEIEKRQADINNSRETPKQPTKPSVESEDDDEMEEGEIEEGDETDNDEEVGVAAPRTAPLMAASSIMAGSTVVGSTLMDDGGSDEEEEEADKEDEDKDSDEEAKDKAKDDDMDVDDDDSPPSKSVKDAPPAVPAKPISKKKETIEATPVKEGRRSRIIKPASAQDHSREASPDNASAGEDEAFEQDQEDETEIQPAHRAEALDTLAIIELKFALLRERVYVEKMESLAWEEALVNDGTHPEMLYMQSELTKRRDTRMRLADARQEVETQVVQRKRSHDEHAIWSWWQFERDQLQTDMISETNRKRRRLERDRRTLERPPPTRRIPLPPPEVGMPTVPLLRKTIESSTPTSAITNKRKRSKHSQPAAVPVLPNSASYPELPRLSQMDIEHDLRFLQAHAQPANGGANTRRSVNIDYAPGGGRMIVPGGGSNAFGVINDGLMGLGGGMSIGLMQSVQVYNEGPGGMPPPMPGKARDMARPSSRQGYFGSGRRSPSPRMGAVPWAGGNGTWDDDDRIIAVQHEKERERDRRERERRDMDLQHQADAVRYRDDKEREQLVLQSQSQQQQPPQQQHRIQPGQAMPPHVHHYPHVHPHHHHHRPHHHHVVHRHLPAQPGATMSPRPPREYDRQAEVINVASAMHSTSPPTAFEGHRRSASSSSKAGGGVRPPLPQGSPPDERDRPPMDRERLPMERDRAPMDRDRPPMAMPFAVPSSSKATSEASRPGSAWARDADMRLPITSPNVISASPTSRFGGPHMERPVGPPMDRPSGPPTPLDRPSGPLGPPMERPASQQQRSRPVSQQHSRQGSAGGGLLSPSRPRVPLPADRPRSPGGAHSRSPSSAGIGRSPSHASVGRSPYHPSTAPGSPHRPAGTMPPPSGVPPTGLSGPGAGLAGPAAGLSGPGALGLAGPALPPLAGPGAPPPPPRQVMPLSTSVSGILASEKMAVDKERLPPVSIPNS